MPRVLVVDDSEDLQEALQIELSEGGFEVSSALDGAQGLQLVREVHPDVVLLDMMMPEMDGLEFLAQLSTQPSPPPVVAQSGFQEYGAEALRRGARTFLVKPVSTAILLSALRSALERRPAVPGVLAQNSAEVERARRAALAKTTCAVSRLDARGMEEVRPHLHRIASWLPTYFGFGSSFVTILRDASWCVEAIHGSMSDRFEEGKRSTRDDFYCDDVLAAGSTLLLTDPLHHPTPHFAHHKVLRRGVQFYVGVPMTAPSGTVLGTLCMVDTRPHEFWTEDMRVLEALGLGAARGLEEQVWPLDEEGAFRREYLELFADVAAMRATREGFAAAEWTIDPRDGGIPAPRAAGLAAVRLDGRLALLWGGPADGWAPTEAVMRHAVASVELRSVRDRDMARRQLLSISA